MENNNTKTKVLILLATFNGSKWIKEQLISIAKQVNVIPHIMMRDDASNDKTVEIALDTCEKIGLSIEIINQENKIFKGKGASKNFFELIIHSGNLAAFEYIALCDQDDIWNKSHLERSIKKLENTRSHGYSSSEILLLKNNKYKKLKKTGYISDLNHFFESPGAGHTFVLSKISFRDLRNFIIKKNKKLNYIEFHDWFIFAYYRSRNWKWIIDDFPSAFYRQHENNVLGSLYSFKGVKHRFR